MRTLQARALQALMVLLAFLGLVLATTAGAAQDLDVRLPTLTDAWVALLGQPERGLPDPAIAWGHAFALREDTAAEMPRRQQRLVRELDSLILSARLQGEAASARTLAAWQTALALQVSADEPSDWRTPGRMDLPWLGANLRQDPPLAKLASWGYCQAPDWVELWSHGGAARLPWRAGLTLAELLDELPADHVRRADYAQVISAVGTVQRRGVAAWNAEPAPLGPGTRVLLELPKPQTPLPFAGWDTGTVTLAWLHRELTEVLASRLPGDDCEVFRQP